MDVIFKQGKLYLHAVKFGKRTWRKIWMVLLNPAPRGWADWSSLPYLTTMLLLTRGRSVGRNPPKEKVVRLLDCLSVVPAPKQSCPPGCTAFYLYTTHCTYTLASTASQDWLSALSLLAFQKDPRESDKGAFERGNGLTMEDNDLYSSWKTDLTLPPNQYHVTVQSTEASRRCKLAGEYLVSPEKEAVILLAIGTGHIFYRWPYKRLRKFGPVKGGFCIEAGRRCESGEGVFAFLSRHGPQIIQVISKQCFVERESSVQPLSVRPRSFSELTTCWPAAPPDHSPAGASDDTKDESADHYSTINDIPVLNMRRLSLVEAHVSERECDEDERFYSLDAVNLDNVTESNIYCNIRRASPSMIRNDEFRPVMDSECIYSDVNVVDSPLNPQQLFFPPPLPQLVPQPPPFTLPQSPVPQGPAKPLPQYQRQPPANNYIQPGYNAQAEALDDMTEMEEAISSSTRVTSREAPGTFKHRLAGIISKDLAKLQPPLPSGAGSPTFF